MAETNAEKEAPGQVFLVRRFRNIGDTWTPWDKPFAEVVEAAKFKVADLSQHVQEFDVVEVRVVRRTRVTAVVETVDVSEVDDA